MSEKSICTLCAKEESPGFYTGCMVKDGHGCDEWECDGLGNLTKKKPKEEPPGYTQYTAYRP